MSKHPKDQHLTAKAAKQFKRRMLLKSGAALAALTPVVPLYVKTRLLRLVDKSTC